MEEKENPKVEAQLFFLLNCSKLFQCSSLDMTSCDLKASFLIEIWINCFVHGKEVAA